MMHRTYLAVPLFGLVMFSGCKSLTRDDPPPPRRFTGVYTGEGTYRYSDQRTLSILRLEAVHIGNQMTLSGTETVEGQVMAVPAITGQVSETGFFTPQRRAGLGAFRAPQCGQVTITDVTMAFASENLRITEQWTTSTCGRGTFSAVLLKER